MTQKPERQFRFWQELKRRGVPRVLAMYAATAFIAIEASDIIFPRLGFPDWTVTLMIVLLIVGFPLAFVLSWVFDITPQGVVKTEPASAEKVPAENREAHRRKLRLSDAVITLLLIIVAVLVYPRIFNGGKHDLPRNPQGKIAIAVMPFKNMTGDTLYNLWQGGFQNLLITALSNSGELSVRQYETMKGMFDESAGINYASLTPSMSGELAQKLDASTVVAGNMYKSGRRIRITANIMNAGNEEIYQSYELEGNREDDFFNLSDSLSMLIKNFLEIRNLQQKNVFDLGKVFTRSTDAYRLFLQAYNCHSRLDYPCAIDLYNKAIQADTNFVSAMVKLAYCYGDIQQAALSKHWAYKAFDRMDRLPPDMQLTVRIVKASLDKNPNEQVRYLKQFLQVHPYSMTMWYSLGWVSFNLEHWQESIEAFEQTLELSKNLAQGSWAWTYLLLGRAYHFTDAHKKEEKIYEEGLERWPVQKSLFLYWQAVCAVSRDDAIKTGFYLDKFQKMTEKKRWLEANRMLWKAGVYDWAASYDSAESYFREALELKPEESQAQFELARFLIRRDINPDEGMEMMAALLEAYPNHPSYLFTYGQGLFKKGNYLEANKVLKNSWERSAFYDHEIYILLMETEKLLSSR